MKKILFGVTTVALTLVLVLVVLEIALRVYSRVTPNVDVEFYRYASLMKASAAGSELGFLHEPDTNLELFGVNVAINSRGFRDEEISPKAPDEIRIGLIGDSITFGWGVPYGERFSEILERKWSEASDSKVSLLNTGHGNYNSQQEFVMLREHLAADRLDGVLQVWYINDAETKPKHRDAPWYSKFYVAIFFWSKSDLLARRVGSRGTYQDYYRSLYQRDAPGYPGFEQAIADVGEWTRERGLPWIFVVLPEFHSFEEGGPFDDVYRQVRTHAESCGAFVVDATEAFRGEDPSELWVAYNDVHPNARGNAIIAEAIANAVSPDHFTQE